MSGLTHKFLFVAIWGHHNQLYTQHFYIIAQQNQYVESFRKQLIIFAIKLAFSWSNSTATETLIHNPLTEQAVTQLLWAIHRASHQQFSFSATITHYFFGRKWCHVIFQCAANKLHPPLLYSAGDRWKQKPLKLTPKYWICMTGYHKRNMWKISVKVERKKKSIPLLNQPFLGLSLLTLLARELRKKKSEHRNRFIEIKWTTRSEIILENAEMYLGLSVAHCHRQP